MAGSSSATPYPAGPRILVVVSGWPRISETFAVNEILALHRGGMLVGIAATKAGDLALVQPGLDELASLVTYLPDGDAAEQADAVAELAQSIAGGVDAVYGYFAHRPAEVAMLAAERLGLRFGFSVHALDLRKVDEDELRRRAAAAAVVVTCNTDAFAALDAHGVRARLVPHGVDLQRFSPVNTPTHQPANAREPDSVSAVRLLAVGRLVEKKGFATLLDALALIDDPHVSLTIVGDGPDRDALTAQIDRLGLVDRVEFAGRATHAELPARYRNADIVVAPSVVDRRGDRDGLPNVVLEAMACGRPLIASDVAAIASAVEHDNNGVLVPPADSAALAAAIRSLAADPERRTALGEAARRTAEQRFDLTHCGERFGALLADAFAPVRPPRPCGVAYLLKGYPRISELFIASEIWRLEQLGVPLRLFVLKRSGETQHHPVVDRIRARPTYLPETTSLSDNGLPRWLAQNLATFRPALVHTARRHPLGFARAVSAAIAQSLRARKGWRPRTIYAKELLLACEFARELDAAGDVTHIHAHFAHGCTTVAWLTSTITGIPFSFTGHAKDIYRESLNPAGLLARKLRAAAFATTCTGANLDHLHAVESHARVHLAYHGLNADFAALLAGAPAAQPPTDTVRIVSVGRMVPKKGFDVLVRAVAELRDRDLPVELVLAGEDGPEAAALRALAGELDVADRIVWRGTVTQAELLAEYRRATMFVLACRVDADGDRDGIPNVLVEAMAAGLPVVSTTVSGIPEVVEDGANGLLVPPDDPHALADAIWRIAKDPGLAASLRSDAAATIADRFDGDRLAADLATRFTRGRA